MQRDVPSPRRCGFYRPGHTPHLIQIRRAHAEIEVPPRPGRLIEVRDDGCLLIDLEGTVVTLWNHDPRRVAALAACGATEVVLQWRWRILSIVTAGRLHNCSVTTVGQATACRPLR